jgi:hypothetical protein
MCCYNLGYAHVGLFVRDSPRGDDQLSREQHTLLRKGAKATHLEQGNGGREGHEGASAGKAPECEGGSQAGDEARGETHRGGDGLEDLDAGPGRGTSGQLDVSAEYIALYSLLLGSECVG